MKKILYSLTLICIIISSCKKDSVSTRDVQDARLTDAEILQLADQAGELHNSALLNLQANYQLSGLRIQDVVDHLADYNSKTLHAQLKPKVLVDYSGEALKDFQSIDRFFDKYGANFDNIEKSYIKAIYDVLIKKSSSVDKIVADLNAIAADVLKQPISSSKKLMLVTATKIGAQSTILWSSERANGKSQYGRMLAVKYNSSSFVVPTFTTEQVVDMIAYTNSYNENFYGNGYSQQVAQRMAMQDAQTASYYQTHGCQCTP